MNRQWPDMPGLVLFAAGVLAGMAAGRLPIPWWCWFAAVLPASGLVLARPRWRAGPIIAMTMLAAGWSGLHRQAVPGNDLMVLTGYDTPAQLVHLEGVVASVGGIRMQLHVTRWFMPHGSVSASGRVVVRLPASPGESLPGRTIRVKGWLNPVRAPRETGEPDWQSLALDGTYRGWMHLESMALLEVVAAPATIPGAWRGGLRAVVIEQVLGSPVPAVGPVRSLLGALLVGQRDHDWSEVAPPFRRLGVAHLLAISGLHLGLVAGMVLVVVRLGTGPRRWQGWIVLLAVAAYLCVVELRPPIVRAGVMTVLAGVGLLNRRRFTGIGLLSVAAILVLVFQPGQVARPGFQLSFGVVAGLLLLASRVRHRWFGPRSWSASSAKTVLAQWTRDAIAASVTAWVISIPVVMGHFGQFSPLAVPMSLLLLPAVAALLALGVLRAILGWLPGISEALGVSLAYGAEAVLDVVDVIDGLPWTSVEELSVGWPWIILATGWAVAWCGLERRRNLLLPVLAVLVGWAVLEGLVLYGDPGPASATIVALTPE